MCSGIPKREANLKSWIKYQNFVKDNPNTETVEVNVKSFVYGDGEITDANEYEVAYFTKRGEEFLERSTVNPYGESKFIILTGICKGKMIRRHAGSGKKRKVFWKCADSDCEGHKHVLNQVRFDTMMATLLNDIAENTDIIKTDYISQPEKNLELSQKTNEVKSIMNSPDTEMEYAICKITELAELCFRCCKIGDNSAVTIEVEKQMAMYPKSDDADGKVIEQIIKSIAIMPDKTATVTLINGKSFERQA